MENRHWALKIENIGINYERKEILKGINLEVLEGEVFGLLGPNGAGKSTLFSVIASILKPKEGKVHIKRGLTIGLVPQEIALYENLTAYDNLSFWASVYGINKKKDSILTLLEFLNLSNVTYESVYKFSTGMKRRLNIGVALVHNPDIIIMDEPTVGIDLGSKLMIIEQIKKLSQYGKTFIYSTHNPDEPEKLCHRIGVLKNGVLEGVGTISEVKKMFSKNTIEELMC